MAGDFISDSEDKDIAANIAVEFRVRRVYSFRTVNSVSGQYSSTAMSLQHGIPQGSVLGPQLFAACVLPVADLILSHDVSYDADSAVR